MKFALVEGEEIVSTILPATGVLPNGAQVSGFDKLDQDTLKEAGWLPIVELGVPDHNPKTQSVEQTYVIGDGVVELVYEVKDNVPTPEPPTPVIPSTQEQLDILVSTLVEQGTITQAQAVLLKTPKPV